jgi:AraC-like DNA-binding protein
MFFIKGPVRLSALAARGDHRLQMLSWLSSTLPSLDQWLQTHAPSRNSQGHSRYVGCKPIDPDFVETIKRFEEAKSEKTEITEPLLLSVVYESVGRIMVGGDEMQLSPLPAELPEAIERLSIAVRENPAGNWSLAEASNMASYSPFHFSRVFKQLVGYGFHEYVDRCRTELAVGMLVSTDIAVDNVATNAGFGTTQGLRESVRDYLGLVPSEFRSLPELYE